MRNGVCRYDVTLLVFPCLSAIRPARRIAVFVPLVAICLKSTNPARRPLWRKLLERVKKSVRNDILSVYVNGPEGFWKSIHKSPLFSCV